MNDNTKFWLTLFGFMFVLGVLSLIDIGLNIVGLIPGIGDVFKTTSETIMELIKFSVTAVGFFVIGHSKR